MGAADSVFSSYDPAASQASIDFDDAMDAAGAAPAAAADTQQQLTEPFTPDPGRLWECIRRAVFLKAVSPAYHGPPLRVLIYLTVPNLGGH